MIERFVLNENTEKLMKELSDTNLEWGGFFLAEFKDMGIVFGEGKINYYDEEEAKISNISTEYLEKARKMPERFTIIPTHAHTRKFGEVINVIDPYWTVNPDDSKELVRGTIVNDFFISRKVGNRGDNKFATYFHNKECWDYQLFVHPAHGSEGSIMTQDKIKLTAYKYDSDSIGKVKEIPLIVMLDCLI